MDWMTICIGFLLVWTGAFFFGYPIGKLVGRRQLRRELEGIPMNFHRGSRDILEEGYLEIKK